MKCRLMKYIPHDYQTRWHKENDKEVMPDEVHPTRISAEGDRQDRQQ